MSILSELAKKVRHFPRSPGVYLIKDAVGRVIYVGKARSLRQRVQNYVADSSTVPPRLQAIRSQMRDLEYMVTDTEVEALILECNLIKEYRPRYNVDLKDDKDYPCLRLTGGPYPRLEYLRLSQKEGRQKKRLLSEQQAVEEREALYFGPYTEVGAVRETMRLLGKIFPLRRCRRPLDGEALAERPCLNYQMKRCLGPCRGAAAVSPEEYGRLVEQVVSFLEGKRDTLERQLEKGMQRAAKEKRFEEAARLRDQLQAVRRITAQEQKVLDLKRGADRDVLALVRHEGAVAVHLFVIREGKLIRREHFPLGPAAAEAGDGEALGAFIKSYYSRGASPPKEIALSAEPDDGDTLENWLNKLSGTRVKLSVPRRGSRRKLVEMALRNGLLRLQDEQERRAQRVLLPLEELGRLAGLGKAPRRIEGYDISHLRGGAAVGVMVVFEQGRPFKDGYRRFHLDRTPPGDDCAALQEVLQRRLSHSEWPAPELMLIDGGRAQLNAARESLQQANAAGIALLALAENPDRIFLEGEKTPVLLPANSTLLQLLQRIRDEAHRFAVDYHRRLRRQGATRSRLEEIPGVGPQRRAALLKHFGNLERLYRATAEELAAVPGISRILAERIYRELHL